MTDVNKQTENFIHLARHRGGLIDLVKACKSAEKSPDGQLSPEVGAAIAKFLKNFKI
jgi:hypothetical protein